MKRLIASDLHGSAVFCRQLLALYRETGAEQLVLLGDLAYSGSYDPRYEYDPQNVIDQLNAIAPDILWMEGNCDYGVGARAPASRLPKYLLQEWDGRSVFLTHGHRYGPQNPPARGLAEILLSGHTHVPAWGRVEDLFCANPGSVSLPRGRSDHSCLLYEDGIFRWMEPWTGGRIPLGSPVTAIPFGSSSSSPPPPAQSASPSRPQSGCWRCPPGG